MLMNKISITTIFFSLSVTTILLLGWLERDEYWYTAKNGLGYAFGITGSVMMLLLLLYPARKYWKPMRNAFKVHHWFRIHMIFGVLGPSLILLHCNFNMGSLNSNIALYSMLLVAGSGLVGRYVYQKIHRGLYGEQIAFSDLNDDYQLSKKNFSTHEFLTKDYEISLTKIEAQLTQRKVSLLTSISAKRTVKIIQKNSIKLLKKTIHSAQMVGEHEQLLIKNFDAWNAGLLKLIKMANYALYNRLFSLWHVFHLPLFFMMIITAIVHVVVVHQY